LFIEFSNKGLRKKINTMTLKYRLNTLGWYNFERLAQTLLKKIIGPGVTSFGGSRDNGRDATFSGSASYPSAATQWSGYWIFQVKFLDFEEFTPKEARVRLLNEAKKEFQKITSRNGKKPDNYILITNITLTSNNRSDLEAIAQNNRISNFISIDGNEICEFLDIHVELRQSHPQLLGLADLKSIINADVYTRSKLYFDEWSPHIGKFVETQAYGRAMQILKEHNFAVIDGPPEVGKSMIAATGAFIYSSRGFQINVIRDPTDFLRIRGSDDHGPQLFIADDAVGSLSYDPGLTERWSQEFSKILRSLDENHKLIWTARSYILKEAIQKSRLDDKVNSFPGIHEILVEMSDLSKIEKAEILYKHAKGGGLNDFEKGVIKESAERIVQDKNFTPERIRQLMNDYIPSCRNKLTLEWKGINDFLKNPGKPGKRRSINFMLLKKLCYYRCLISSSSQK